MEGLLSINNEISTCELNAAKILQKLIKLESPEIVKENLNLILLLAANCRSHILDHVQHQFGEEYTKETNLPEGNKSPKKRKNSGNNCLPKEDNVKIEVASSDDGHDINTHQQDNQQSIEDDIDTNTDATKNPPVECLKIGQYYSDYKDERGMNDNYGEYNADDIDNDDNIDDEDYEADPLYGEDPSNPSKNLGEIDQLICHICRRRFKTKDGLIVHIDTFDHNKFSCDECGKAFPKKNKLERHKTIHTGVRPYSCDLCEKDFKSSYRLTEHKQLKHGIEKRTIACQFCDKEFTSDQNMKLHTEKAHSNKDTLFHCDKCDKTFARSSALWYHKKVHIKVDEAEYNCESCVKSFRNQRRLEFHLKKIHGFVKEKNILLSKDVLSCEQCEMKFSSQNNLMNHILKHARERQTL